MTLHILSPRLSVKDLNRFEGVESRKADTADILKLKHSAHAGRRVARGTR